MVKNDKIGRKNALLFDKIGRNQSRSAISE